MNNNLKEKFGKVGVLMGGWSAEREISLNSGQAVFEALLSAGVDAHRVDVNKKSILSVLQLASFDRVFNVLHGRGGEDGVLQGVFEILNIPYTGCGVMASAISMNKLATKRIWKGASLSTPKSEILTVKTNFQAVVAHLGLPLMVKPATEGSSIGMTKVTDLAQLFGAYKKAAKYCDSVFAEQWIVGEEYTVAILDGEALPLIRLEVQSDFYDYNAKYISNETQYHCPCGLNKTEEKELQTLAETAFSIVNAKGWGRIDMMHDQQNKTWLIEINTVPGMTSHSLVPMAAKARGLDFKALVVRILETTLA